MTPFVDTRALANPLVIRVAEFFYIMVGNDCFGEKHAGADYPGTRICV
jgi:hypothetical protein